jgi:ferredoxin
MPVCEYCGLEFNRDRDTKRFCKATCRSLFRYHKKGKVKDEKISVQEKPVSVQEEDDSVTDELCYDNSDETTPAEEFNQ